MTQEQLPDDVVTEGIFEVEETQISIAQHIDNLGRRLYLSNAEHRHLKQLFTDGQQEDVDDTDELISATTKVRERWLFCLGQGHITPAPTLLEKTTLDTMLGLRSDGKNPLPRPRKPAITQTAFEQDVEIMEAEAALDSITGRFCKAVQEFL